MKKEAEEKGEEYVDPEDPEEYANRTQVDARRAREPWETDHLVKRLELCEQHFYRLNMSSLKARNVRCAHAKLMQNDTLCEKLRGCSWNETENAAQPAAGASETENATGNTRYPGRCVGKVPTTNDVKRSYRRMAMAWHPDKKKKASKRACRGRVTL